MYVVFVFLHQILHLIARSTVVVTV